MYTPSLAEHVSIPGQQADCGLSRRQPALTEALFDPDRGSGSCPEPLPAPSPSSDKRAQPLPELGAQEPLLRQLCELAQAAIYVVDVEHRRLLMASRPCYELLGMAQAELAQVSAESLLTGIHAQDHAAVRAQLTRSCAGLCAPITECDFRFRRRDGEWRWLRNRIAVLSRDPLGRARHLIGSALDITLQRKLPDRLARPSLQDALTGVGNRTAYELEIKRLSTAHGGPVSVLLVDLDGLRRVNDSQGPEAGDDLLRRTAELLRENCRAEDLVARIGGDEFAVLLRCTNEATGRAVLARLRAAVAADTERTPLRISLGLATANAQESIEGAVRRAECALFADKVARRR
jgi:diguanylate cyclase (GGDEF)-like protein/PAS domain S-box-containing protein